MADARTNATDHESAHNGALEGKVALLIGAGEDGRSLALDLADQGADIVLVFAEPNRQRALTTQRLVEETGRHCLAIAEQDRDGAFAARTVQRILDSFGRLDLFFDTSTIRTKEDSHGDAANRPAQVRLFPHFELVMASIGQIRKQRTASHDRRGETSKRSSNMKLAQKLKGLPIITIDTGRNIGKVQDVYLDQDLSRVTALNLGSEGFLSRKSSVVRQSDVVTLGQDAILVQNAECVVSEAEDEQLKESLDSWQTLSALNGRQVTTPGGTRIGRIGDVILEEGADVRGFSLSQTFVSGPIADNSAINRSAMIRPETEDGDMTIDLTRAESAELQIVNVNPFTPPSVVPVPEETARNEN